MQTISIIICQIWSFSFQITGTTIEESIQKEFSGDIQTALLTMGIDNYYHLNQFYSVHYRYYQVYDGFCIFLVSFVNDPLASHISKINKTIKDNANAFSQIVIYRSEVR